VIPTECAPDGLRFATELVCSLFEILGIFQAKVLQSSILADYCSLGVEVDELAVGLSLLSLIGFQCVHRMKLNLINLSLM
jgi:hypothetical protein